MKFYILRASVPEFKEYSESSIVQNNPNINEAKLDTEGYYFCEIIHIYDLFNLMHNYSIKICKTHHHKLWNTVPYTFTIVVLDR